MIQEGSRLGRQVVLHLDGSSPKRWIVRCDCGNVRSVSNRTLIYRNVRSCGCLRKDTKSNRTHGRSKTVEYRAYLKMRSRCENPDDSVFEYYGARGIKVCDRWREGFEAFFEDMGLRPTDKRSLDRIEVNGDYEPGNCRWATPTEQGRNKRTTILFEIDGITKPLTAWAEVFGIDYDLVDDRRRKGWDTLKALTSPRIEQDEKPVHHGEDNGNARLTADDVVQIKRLLASGLSQRKIATMFSVSQKAVWMIHHGQTWVHHRDADAV